MKFAITSTIDTDFVGNENLLDSYDFDNQEFTFVFDITTTGDTRIGTGHRSYLVEKSIEEVELVCIYDENNLLVEMDSTDYLENEFFNENFEHGTSKVVDHSGFITLDEYNEAMLETQKRLEAKNDISFLDNRVNHFPQNESEEIIDLIEYENYLADQYDSSKE